MSYIRLVGTRALFWILTFLSAILFFSPLRTGDLPGYDDAEYSLMAKTMVQTGDWVNLRSNGYPALEHPPMLEWMEASVFKVFGISDAAARFPAAACGFLTVLLLYWLARKMLGTPFAGVLTMFILAGTVYFLKYASHAMSDVPFTLFFLCGICAWVMAEEDPRWYLAAGVCIALVQMTRSMMGVALPAVFALHALASKRRVPVRYAISALMIGFGPTAWLYAHWLSLYGTYFVSVHATFLKKGAFGELTPAWRRYTGIPEYLWMIAKSYWPWLPLMIAGLVLVIRGKDRKLSLLIYWPLVIFLLCAVTHSRVLRYMLPAYPAFSILAAIGLMKFVSEQTLRRGLTILLPILGVGVIALAIHPPVTWHATEIRPIAAAATAATPAGERYAFHDGGLDRNDETNQLQWYGDRYLIVLFSREELLAQLRNPQTRVFVLDKPAYEKYIAPAMPNRILAESGHLVCVRLL